MKKQKTYVAMLLAALVILSLAGCGMKNSKDNAEATTGWSVENPDNTTKDKKTTESTDAEDNIEEDADLMDKLTADNEDMSYEFREETQDLTSYDSGNPGAEGYQFHVYESEGGKKTGDYYVDKDTGKVYRYTKDNKIMEY